MDSSTLWAKVTLLERGLLLPPSLENVADCLGSSMAAISPNGSGKEVVYLALLVLGGVLLFVAVFTCCCCLRSAPRESVRDAEANWRLEIAVETAFVFTLLGDVSEDLFRQTPNGSRSSEALAFLANGLNRSIFFLFLQLLS